MISFSFIVNNPWGKTWKNLWNKSYKTPFMNKFLELEVLRDSSIVYFMFKLVTRQSHSGFCMELGLLGYNFGFNFYDNRHWNYIDDKYFEYGEDV